MKPEAEDDGAESFLQERCNDVERRVRAKSEELESIKLEAKRLLERQIQVEQEKERLSCRQKQLAAAHQSLITPPRPFPGSRNAGTSVTPPDVKPTNDEEEKGARGKLVKEESCAFPWLSTSGADSLAGFDHWRQERDANAKAPESGKVPSKGKTSEVIVLLSSDSDTSCDEKEPREKNKIGPWPDRLPTGTAAKAVKAGPSPPPPAQVGGVPRGGSASCSGLVNSLGCRMACCRPEADHPMEGASEADVIQVGRREQGVGKPLEERVPAAEVCVKNWRTAHRRSNDEEKVKRLQRTRMDGLGLVRFHLSKRKAIAKVNAALTLDKETPTSGTDVARHASTVQRAQAMVDNWEYKYLLNCISRRNRSVPTGDEAVPAAAIPPPVGHRLDIYYKGSWCTADVIHYSFCDGEHTVLLDGNLVRSINMAGQRVREQPRT